MSVYYTYPIHQTPDSTHHQAALSTTKVLTDSPQTSSPRAGEKHSSVATRSELSHTTQNTIRQAPAARTAFQPQATPATPIEVATDTAVNQVYIPYPMGQQPAYEEPVQEVDEGFISLDSIFANSHPVEVVQKKSLFTEHTLPVSNQQMVRADQSASVTPDWVFVTIVLFFSMMGSLLRNYRFRVVDVFQAAVDIRGVNHLSRQSNSNNFRSLLPMALVYVSSIALVIYRLVVVLGVSSFEVGGFGLFAIIWASMLMYYFVRNGFILLSGNIFDDEGATSVYISNTYIYNFLGGIVLLPLLLLVFYSSKPDTSLLIAEIWVAIMFVGRLIRGLQIILTNAKSSKFYFFYYLCIFEIVPILVVLKVVISY